MGKSNDVSSTTTAEPWGEASSELNDIVDLAQGMYQSGALDYNSYDGQRVADMSALTQQGIDALSNLSTELPAGTMEALYSNLNMDDTYRDFDVIKGTVADDTKASLASTFAGGGINSGLAQDTYTKALTEALAGVEYDAYNAAKDRQLQAIGLGGDLATTQQALDANAAAGMLTGGGLYDEYNQALIDAEREKWDEDQMQAINALQQYSSFIYPASGMGGTTTTTTSDGGTSLTDVAGAAATGLGTYGSAAALGATGPLGIGAAILAGLGSL